MKHLKSSVSLLRTLLLCALVSPLSLPAQLELVINMGTEEIVLSGSYESPTITVNEGEIVFMRLGFNDWIGGNGVSGPALTASVDPFSGLDFLPESSPIIFVNSSVGDSLTIQIGQLLNYGSASETLSGTVSITGNEAIHSFSANSDAIKAYLATLDGRTIYFQTATEPTQPGYQNIAPAGTIRVIRGPNAIPMVRVGDAGNANDTTGFGGVAYDYYIGKFPVTNAQYAAFLNSVAATGDPHGLWHSLIGSTVHGGISRSGAGTASDPFIYSVRTASEGFNEGQSMGNMPINRVSFWNAARFTNWLTTGNTETGVYVLTPQGISDNTITRDVTAWENGGVAIASENEWYKAAYYDPTLNVGSGGYWLYPTRSNDAPTAMGPNNTNANSANFGGSGNIGTVTEVGGYELASSFYGTFDQGGNVWEWNDDILGPSDDHRGLRGGSFSLLGVVGLQSSGPDSLNPIGSGWPIGFRVSSRSPIPELSSLVVTTTADTVNPFDGHTSLREAIAFAVTLGGPQIITFSDTTAGGATNFYDGTARTIMLGGSQLEVTGQVSIVGPGADVLSISGNLQSRVFRIEGEAEVELNGITITQGRMPNGANVGNGSTGGKGGDGGGIFLADGGALILSNTVLVANQTGRGGDGGTSSTGGAGGSGGGIYQAGGTLQIVNSSLRENLTGRGGNATTSGFGGAGGRGGGIYQAGGTLQIINSTLSENLTGQGGNATTSGTGGAGGSGGAIYQAGGTLEIISSTLRGNIAGRGGNTGTAGTGGAGGSGGGIYHANGEISLTNTTVVSNAAGARGMFSNSGTAGAGGRGGGIHLAGGELSLHNSTLSGNAAGTNAVGGGIFNAGSVVVHNTILAGNTAAGAQRDFAGTAATGSHNLFGIGGQSGFVNGVDGNLVGTLATPLDPRLGPLADNGGPTQTLALLPDSPALFAADAFAVLASDQRGIVRPQGVAPDIGAFETEVNASVTLGNLEQVFGSTSPPTATTDPVDLDVLIFYNGSTTFPTSTGTFDVRAVATGDGFFGGALDTLVITQASQTITFPEIADQVTTANVTLTATATSGLPVSFALEGPAILDGNSLSFTGPGSVEITATQAGNDNWNAASPVVRTFAVAKAPATVALNPEDLTWTFDGTPKAVGVTTVPDGLTVTVTYNGETEAPSAAGSYTVVATVVSEIYQGSVSGTLIIAPAAQSISFNPEPELVQLATASVPLNATATSGLPVILAVTEGSGELDSENNLTFTGAGSVVLTATQPGNSNWQSAPLVARTFTVTRATATVTLNAADLARIFDGTPKAVGVTTVPEALNVILTYNGASEAPSAAGSYAVVATIDDAIFQGEAFGTLVIQELGSLIVTTDEDIVDPTDGLTSLREAIAFAATLDGPQTVTFSDTDAGGAVNFHDGTARIIFLNGEPLLLSSEITIMGPGANRLSISGDLLSRIFEVGDSAVASILGMSIIEGRDPVEGGAILNVGQLVLDGTAFRDNGSLFGGGFLPPEGLPPEGLPPEGQPLDPWDGPIAPFTGGAITNLGTMQILNSTFSDNHADWGGAIANEGDLEIVNSTFVWNSASSEGSAIANFGDILLQHVTIAGNQPLDTPGVISIGQAVTSIQNAIILDGFFGSVVDLGNNLLSGDAAEVGLEVDGDGMPLLRDHGGQTETVALMPGSAALFAAVHLDGLSADQRGVARPQGPAADLGAFEAELNATVSLGNLEQVFGSTGPVTVVTDPAGLDVRVTYNGETAPPTAVGTYAVRAVTTGEGIFGGALETLVITPADQTIDFPEIADQVTTASVTLSATATSGLPVSLAVVGPAVLDGNSLSFTGPGSVEITATQAGNDNWNAASPVVRTFTVTRATATVTLNAADLTRTFDGTPKTVGVSTVPEGLTVSVTYDGETTPPSAAGSYNVVATVVSEIYQGSATGTLVIGNALQTITFAPELEVLTTATVPLIATASSGLPVTLAVTDGPGALDAENNLTFSGAGSVVVTATQPGNDDWDPASPVVRTFTVTRATATVTLNAADLTRTFDGTPKEVGVSTVPEGLTVTVTYDGETTPPSAAGSYTVVATVVSEIYQGNATGTLVIGEPGSLLVTTDEDVMDPTDGLTSLREAIAYAATLDGPQTITFSDSDANGAVDFFDGLNRTILLDGEEFVISSDVTIEGPGAFALEISGGHQSRIFRIVDGTNVTIEGLTLLNGNAADGGGILNLGDLTVRRSVVRNNTGIRGAGIHTAQGDLRVLESEISHHFADFGGQGGGIFVESGTVALENTTVALNVSLDFGGGLYNQGGVVTVLHATFAGNTSADMSGEAIYSVSSDGVEVRVQNSIIAGPFAGNRVDLGNNLLVNSSVAAGLDIHLDETPILQANGGPTRTIALLGGSPALGNAAPLAGLTTDQRGVARPQGAAPDIGAFERPLDTQDIDFPPIENQLANASFALAATASSGLPVAFAVQSGPAIITDGVTLSFTGAGEVTLIASQEGNATYLPAENESQSFTVTRATATVTLDAADLTRTFDGTPKAVGISTVPEGLTVTVTYDGETTPPSAAGSYNVVATVVSEIYQGSATGTLVIGNALQTITFAPELEVLTTATVPLIATASSGLPVTLAVTDGPGALDAENNLTFSGAGSVVVTATQPGNDDWDPASPVVRTFTVTRATATVTLNAADLTRTFDGTPKAVGISTVPEGLTVTVTYDGETTPPSAAGSYNVVATVVSEIYQGSATGTLVIGNALQTITFAPELEVLTTATVPLIATASSGLPVTLAVTDGPGALDAENNLTFSGAGSVVVTATQPGNDDWDPASPVVRTFTVTRATATVTLNAADLTRTFDGTPKTVGVSTVPEGLTVTVTYDGETEAPSAAGSYAVVATIDDDIFQGQANGTLIISPATQTITFPAIEPQLITDTVVLSATASSGLPIQYSIIGPAILTGNELSFTGGDTTVRVTATQPGDNNWLAAPSVERSFSVSRLQATILVSNLNQVFDGTPRPVTVQTIPEGLPISVISYDDSLTVPTAAGTYLVIVKVNEEIYAGFEMATLVISKADQAISEVSPADGSRFAVNSSLPLSGTAESGLPVTFASLTPDTVSISGNTATFLAPGPARIRFLQPGDSNWNAAEPIDIEAVVGGEISGISPDQANIGGGIEVVISGAGLGNGSDISEVRLAGVPATLLSQTGDTVTVFVNAAEAPGTGDVEVTSATNGTLVLEEAFTYRWLAAPELLDPVEITASSLVARWNLVPEAEEHLLDAAQDPEFTVYLPGFEQLNVMNTTQQLIPGLEAGDWVAIRVFARDAHGLSLPSRTVWVPIGDNIPFETHPPSSGPVSVGAVLRLDPTLMFHGTGMNFTVDVSDPARVNATVDLDGRIVLRMLQPGIAEITVTATDPASGYSSSLRFTVFGVVAPPAVEHNAFLEREPWNMRFTQQVRIRNTSGMDAVGVRILFTDLAPGTTVENQTGVAADGRPIVDVAGAFPAGGQLSFNLVYLATLVSPEQSPPTLAFEYILSEFRPPLPARGTLITRHVFLQDGTGRMMIEFESVPGGLYAIQYMNNFPDGGWVEVPLRLRAGANRTQWIDAGPPATRPLEGVRVYRVVHIGEGEGQ